MKLVDVAVSKAASERSVGSSPTLGTNFKYIRSAAIAGGGGDVKVSVFKVGMRG